MGEHVDDLKGRAKEAVGDLTDDEGLRREGKADRIGATIKEKVDTAREHLDDAVDKVKDATNRS